MRLQDLYLTLAVQAEGKPKVLYVGFDAVQADKAYRGAGEGVKEVGVISHPQCVFPRFPEEEIAATKKANNQAEAEATEQARQKEAKLNALRAEHEKLQKEIDSLEGKQKPKE